MPQVRDLFRDVQAVGARALGGWRVEPPTRRRPVYRLEKAAIEQCNVASPLPLYCTKLVLQRKRSWLLIPKMKALGDNQLLESPC